MRASVGSLAIAAACTLAAITHAQTRAEWRWVPIGGGGAVMTVVVSPHRSNVVLTGADLGGVLRSEDFGRHWTVCNRGLYSDGDRGVAAFAWHPTEPQVVFMGAGACFGRPQGPYGGLFRSADEGRTWELVSREVRFSGFGSQRQWGNVLKVDPRDGSLWAGTAWDGVMRSADGGATWQRLGVDGHFIVGVELGPGEPGTVYVGAMPAEGCEGGVWVTRDGGATWRETLQGEAVRSVAADPQVPGRAYAAVQDKGVLITDDYGETWRISTAGIAVYLEKLWAHAVAVNPRQPETVYFCAGERFGDVPEWWRWRHPGIFVSRDRGESWAPIISAAVAGGEFSPDAYLGNVDAAGWWNSKEWFGFNPFGFAVDPADGRRLYMHDWYGVWASDDGGESWRAAMDGLATTCVRTIACHPQRADEAYLGLQDVGLFRTADGGESVQRMHNYPSSDCTNLAVETREGAEVIYSVVGGSRLVLSRDRGATWEKAPGEPPEGAQLSGVALDPFQPHGIYCGRWRTRDGGATWEELSGLPEDWSGTVLPDPTSRGRLYAWNEFEALASADGGATWRDVSEGLPLVHAGKRRIEALTVLPETGRVFAGSAAQGLFVSDDQGASWRCVLPNRYISAVGCAAEGRTVVAAAWRPWYAAQQQPGVFISWDGGETWEQVDQQVSGIAEPLCVTLDPHVPGRIWLGTHGDAAYVADVTR
jgi:hypothetical protein